MPSCEPACHRPCGTPVIFKHRSEELAAWVRCPVAHRGPYCDGFWCQIHGTHTVQCACPPFEDWADDPRSTGGPTGAARGMEPFCPTCEVFTDDLDRPGPYAAML